MAQTNTASAPAATGRPVVAHEIVQNVTREIFKQTAFGELFRDDNSLSEKFAIVMAKREEILAAEFALNQATESAKIAEQTLISDMLEQGLRSFKTATGENVMIDVAVYPRVNAADRSAQHEWLRSIGLGDLIKTREDVNAQTFAAECRRRLAEGETLPEFVKVSSERKLKIKG